jgi:hypothetical protein
MMLYGIGQGSGASPILWALLNHIILTTLEEKNDCIQLIAIPGDILEQLRGHLQAHGQEQT